MQRQFFIPGLGADESVFQRLEDFGTEKVLIQWVKNEKNESLHDYSQRLIVRYGITQNDIVVGLSFGGLIAQQIVEILDSQYVILLSSFRTSADLRWVFRIGLKLRLHKLMPQTKFPYVSEVVANYLNSGTKASRPLLKDMIIATDMKLMKWSIEKIYEHKEELAIEVPKYNLIGNKDRIVGLWANDTTHEIDGGSHFMVYDHAKEVSKIINDVIRIER